jgi:excisionase family DNA binding protein
MTSNMEAGYRSLKQAANELEVHPATLRRWIKRKLLEGFQPFAGANIRMRVEELEAFRKRSKTSRAK